MWLALVANAIQWIILFVLMTWAIAAFWPEQKSSVELPYSTFVDQIQAGNVTDVTIRGNEILGQFAQAVTWPPPPPEAGGATAVSPQMHYGHHLPKLDLVTLLKLYWNDLSNRKGILLASVLMKLLL
jgi:ATP-dependent Zn protease